MPPHSFNSSVGGKKLGKPSRGDFFLYLDVFSLLALVHSTPDKSPLQPLGVGSFHSRQEPWKQRITHVKREHTSRVGMQLHF